MDHSVVVVVVRNVKYHQKNKTWAVQKNAEAIAAAVGWPRWIELLIVNKIS
jgi:hypothetical protein